MRGVTLTLPKPTTRWGLTEVTLYLGETDEVAREVFAWGYCATFAAALHEITAGWPLAVFERIRDGKWAFVHAGVMVPGTGLFLDVQGARDPDDVERDWVAHDGPFRFGTFDDSREGYRRLGFPPGTSWQDGMNVDLVAVVLSIARRVVEVTRCAA